MCLAVPAQIVRMNSPVEALCDFGGVKKAVDVTLIADPKEGDWVIVHVGFALEKIDEEKARETLELLAEAANLAEAPKEGGAS
mgnify:CR=1 FL=1